MSRDGGGTGDGAGPPEPSPVEPSPVDASPVEPSPAEAVTPAGTPRPVRRPVIGQRWADLAFLHWAVAPDVVAPHLPAGVRPDVHEDRTYVALVPFRMARTALLGGPAVPWLGRFLETNVRLYGVDARGRRSVVFASLEADRLVPVLVARAAGLPYLWSRMRFSRIASADGDLLTYRCSRRWPGPRGAGGRVAVRVREPITSPGPLEHFLTARWGLHARGRGGRGAVLYWPNDHPAWPLHRAELLHLDDTLLAAAGFPGLADRPPDSVLFSPGVDVVFGPRTP